MTDQYIVIVSRPWMNETGHGWNHASDLVRFDERQHAIVHGYQLDVSDDFNIGTLRGGRLTAVGWMWDDFGPDDAGISEISAALGLKAGES